VLNDDLGFLSVAFEGGVLFVEPKGPLSNIGFKTPEVTEFLRKSDGRVLSLAVVFTPILRIGCVVGRGVGVDVVLVFTNRILPKCDDWWWSCFCVSSNGK